MGEKGLITKKNAGSPDFLLLIITLLLISIGIVMVFSASVGYLVGFEGTTDVFRYFKPQLLWATLGLVCMSFFLRCNLSLLRRYALTILIIGLAALVLVYVPSLGGISQRGSARWLKLGFMTIQPSESIKLALAIFLAAKLAQKGAKGFDGLGACFIAIAACAALVISQPDLGTTAVIAVTALCVLFVAGIDFRYFGAIIGTGLAGAYVVVTKTSYMAERIQVWRDPWAFISGKGYQTVNALLALGSGGIFGVGLGRGMQKFGRVPENHTDMIFSIIGEELGLIGSAIVILLFVLFIWRGLSIAARTKDPFRRYLAVGITCMIGFQAFLNLGVVIDLLPVTGVTLPFISYGGSSLLLNMAAVGILLNISRFAEREESIFNRLGKSTRRVTAKPI